MPPLLYRKSTEDIERFDPLVMTVVTPQEENRLSSNNPDIEIVNPDLIGKCLDAISSNCQVNYLFSTGAHCTAQQYVF